MTRGKSDLFAEVVVFLWTLSFSRGDTDVSCVFMERCILPCSFRSGNEPIVHWTHETSGYINVHSYINNQDQLGHQDQRFRSRTSLFKDQISRGNASLQLTEVEVQDQGRYKCLTSTTRGNKESYINLKVDAPVDKVDIQQVENRIICSSEGIYPEPGLTWSTSPPSNMDLQRTTTIHQTEQQLYNINSSLILSDSDTDLVYICTVSTRSNNRTVTVFILRLSVSGLSVSGDCIHVGVIVGLVVVTFIIAAAAAVGVLMLYSWIKKKIGSTNEQPELNNDENIRGIKLQTLNDELPHHRDEIQPDVSLLESHKDSGDLND